MKPIEVPYDEGIAIDEMKKLFKKNDGYSFLVPISKQQKGYDFVILNTKTNKIVRVQVKGSKTDYDDRNYKYYLFLNNFIARYQSKAADIYIFVGSCTEKGHNIKQTRTTNILLAFEDGEMLSILKKAVTKKERKPDKFIGIGLNDMSSAIGCRGALDGYNFTKYLLVHQINTLRKKLQ